MNKLLSVLIVLCVTACSNNQAWYESIRASERRNCFKLPPSQYEDCRARTNTPYEDYQYELQKQER